MANIQSVQYSDPAQGQAPPWARLLSGMIQGGAGQISLQQAQAMKQQEEQQKAMGQLAIAFAQQNRLNPVSKDTAGSFAVGGQNWGITPYQEDASKVLDRVKAQQIQQELSDPQAATWNKILQNSVSDKLAFGEPDKGYGIMDIMAAIDAAKQGVGLPEPGTPATKGFFGLGAKPAGPTTRKRMTKNGLVTETLNPDGTWGSEASKPDKHGYIVGQVQTIPGKGTYQYMGNDQWQKQ